MGRCPVVVEHLAQSRDVDGLHSVSVARAHGHIPIGPGGVRAARVRHVYQKLLRALFRAAAQYLVAGNTVVVRGVPGQGQRAVSIVRNLQVGRSGWRLRGAAATAAVAALVSASWCPASSVNDTRTLTALPSSASARVYVELVAPDMSAYSDQTLSGRQAARPGQRREFLTHLRAHGQWWQRTAPGHGLSLVPVVEAQDTGSLSLCPCTSETQH